MKRLLLLALLSVSLFAQTWQITPPPGDPIKTGGGGGAATSFSFGGCVGSGSTITAGTGCTITTSGTGVNNANELSGTLLSGLSGVAIWTAGVPGVASGTCNSSTLVGGDGVCKTVSNPNIYTSAGFTGIGPTAYTPANTISFYDATATTGVTEFSLGQDGSGSFGAGHTSATKTRLKFYLGQTQGVSIPVSTTDYPVSFLSNAGTLLAGMSYSTQAFYILGATGFVNEPLIASDFYVGEYLGDTALSLDAVHTSAAGSFGWRGSHFGAIDTTLCRPSAGIVEVASSSGCGTTGTFTGTNLRAVEVAVGSLPSCGAGTAGQHASVLDSNAVSFTAGIGAVVAAGGSTHVPVYCDGTNWRIG